MTTQIAPIHSDLLKETLLKEEKYAHIKIGVIFLTNSHYSAYIKVVDITTGKIADYAKEDTVNIHYSYATPSSFPEFAEYSTKKTLNDFEREYGNYQYVNSLEEIYVYQEQALKLLAGESLPDEFSLNTVNDDDTQSTALMGKSSKQHLMVLEKDLTVKKNHLAVVMSLVSIEMEKRKSELERIKDSLHSVLKGFMKQIIRVQKLITTIELYLGIEEELVQLSDGQKAPQDTPISFRQLVLYMDEEVGEYEDGGFDYNDIGKFDAWLFQDKNYEKLIPEPKGMVVLHPRRWNKNYEDRRAGEAKNQANKYDTYLLIRNGDVLYRVFSENLVMLGLLFPQREEFNQLLEALKEARYEDDKQKIEDKVHIYQKQTFMLQGLIDRTDVFHPLPVPNLNLFDLENAGDKIRFIYDAEPALTEGRKPFNDWLKEINGKIKRGSRILMCFGFEKGTIHNHRLFYYCSEYNTPSTPNSGIYEVESKWEKDTFWVTESEYNEEWLPKSKALNKKLTVLQRDEKRYSSHSSIRRGMGEEVFETGLRICTEKEVFYILYNPKDEIYGGAFRSDYEPHERKKRIGFKLKVTDNEWINYDQIDLSDVEYYLNSRVERPQYLNMMPVLKNIKKRRLAELEQEKLFVQFVIEDLTRKKIKGDLETMVWNAVAWWKYKNIWKRPIEKDDAKAFRMIMQHIISSTK